MTSHVRINIDFLAEARKIAFNLGGANDLLDVDNNGEPDNVAFQNWQSAKEFCANNQINSRNTVLSDNPDHADFNGDEELDLDEILLALQISG